MTKQVLRIEFQRIMFNVHSFEYIFILKYIHLHRFQIYVKNIQISGDRNILDKNPFELWESTNLFKYIGPPKHLINIKCALLNKINSQRAYITLHARPFLP